MAIFHCYVSSPEGSFYKNEQHKQVMPPDATASGLKKYMMFKRPPTVGLIHNFLPLEDSITSERVAGHQSHHWQMRVEMQKLFEQSNMVSWC